MDDVADKAEEARIERFDLACNISAESVMEQFKWLDIPQEDYRWVDIMCALIKVISDTMEKHL